MTQDDPKLEKLLDRAIDEIRSEAPEPRRMQEAAGRVLGVLRRESAARPGTSPAAAGGSAAIAGCAGFRELLPDHAAGRLPAARRLLVDDHLHECPGCRRALAELRRGGPRAHRAAPARRTRRRPRLVRGLVAVAAILVVAVGVLRFGPRLAALGRPAAEIAAVEGRLFEVSGGELVPLAAGAALEPGRSFRTAKDSGALVTLADGSRVELRERSEVSVEPGWLSTTLQLERGAVLVAAADQGAGHLYVKTSDCNVGVTGTVFSVSHGTKGSRVSVVEGEVRVKRAGETTVLHPGEQLTTQPNVEPVPVANEIAWSRFLDEKLAALEELAALKRQLETVALPPPRHASALADLLPEDTAVYIGLPNLSGTLAESYAVIKSQLAARPELARWWNDSLGAEGEEALDTLVERIGELGAQIGEEIVIALPAVGMRPGGGLLLLAEAPDPERLRALLAAELTDLEQRTGEELPIRLLSSLDAAPSGHDELLVLVDDGLLAGSTDAGMLRRLVAARRSGARPFAATPLRARLASAYAEGAEWIAGLDLGGAIRAGRTPSEPESRVLEALGIDGAEHLIATRKHENGRSVDRVLLTFDRPRHGLVSWLAAPAPMGSLEFVSPGAHAVFAAVLKDPEEMLDDIVALGAREGGPLVVLEPLLESQGIDLARDIAGPLGGEIAFALDGPLLPTPTWVLVLEVYDSEHLLSTLETLSQKLGGMITIGDKRLLEFERTDEIAGRPAFALRSTMPPVELQFAFSDGYLVAAPSRAALERALRQHESGYSLADAPEFLERLPRDRYADFSALVYQDLGRSVQALANRAAEQAGRSLSDEERRALGDVASAAGPVVGVAYGFDDRIEIAVTGSSLFGSKMADAAPVLGRLPGLGFLIPDGR